MRLAGPSHNQAYKHQTRLLTCEWRCTRSHSRRRELARQIVAISILLGTDLAQNIGCTDD
jgi:hypothetical protein